MPTLLALCLATAVAVVIGMEWGASLWLRSTVGLMAWIGLFTVTKRYFSNLKT